MDIRPKITKTVILSKTDVETIITTYMKERDIISETDIISLSDDVKNKIDYEFGDQPSYTPVFNGYTLTIKPL